MELMEHVATEMVAKNKEDNYKLYKTKTKIEIERGHHISAQNADQKSLQNQRRVNYSSELIRIKSSEMHESMEWSAPSFRTTLDQVPTCDPYAMVLMDKACTSNLTKRDQQIVLNELIKKPSFIHEINLKPVKLPELIERNPLIAYEVLLKLVHRIDDTAYYEVILEMPLSLHSLEVINRLCTTTVLPMDFVKSYIVNILKKCEQMSSKCLQARYVRFICVFLASIVRSKVYAVEDIYFRILAFCVGFYPLIKESASLWCLIKHFEFTDTPNAMLAASLSALSIGGKQSSDGTKVSTSKRKLTARPKTLKTTQKVKKIMNK